MVFYYNAIYRFINDNIEIYVKKIMINLYFQMMV